MKPASFLPLIIIVLAAYFLFLRPQKARQRKAQALSSAIAPGQRVMTTAGMYATVVAVDDDGVTLEIAPGVHGRFVRQAISRVVEPELEPVTDLEDTDAEDTDGSDTDVPDTDQAPAGDGVDLVKTPAADAADATPYTPPAPYTPAAPYSAAAYDGPARVVDLGKDEDSEHAGTDQATSSSALH